MLALLGMNDVSELFSDIPAALRREPDLPQGRDELGVMRELETLLSRNLPASAAPCFLGGGVYHHFIPAAVEHIVSRSEFYTSYTPYQAEISQGMLQALFEYQSLVCEISGMDVANSSLYDGASALGEAARMCRRLRRGTRFLVPAAMSAERAAVLESYLRGSGVESRRYGYGDEDGQMALEDIRRQLAEGDVCGLYAEMPNFLGIMDPGLMELREILGDVPLVIGVNPICLGVAAPPGEMGADIVVGEGQPLGSPLNYGGPLLGLFACRQEHMRKMPGRVVGLTADARGEDAYCLTLQTREQHIRRSRATSNICTNSALGALAAAVHLSLLGAEGLRDLAQKNMERASRLMGLLSELPGVRSPRFNAFHFNEFAIELPLSPEEVSRRLLDEGIVGGLPLGRHLAERKDCMLLASTEMHSDEDQDRLLQALEGIL